MLKNGPYPAYLKQRISSDLGHLSNYDAALLTLEHAHPKVRNIMLSHLSIINNTPHAALRTFSLVKEREALKPRICISERHKPSDYIALK